MDEIDKRFYGDLAMMFIVLLLSVFLFAYFSVPGVLLAGSLALTVLVVGIIVLSRRG